MQPPAKPVPDPAFHAVWRRELGTLAARFGERMALTDASGPVSFRTLVGRADALAEAMRAAGIGPGVRVATLIRNSAAAVHASFAIALTGACEVTLNPAQGADEQDWCIEVTEPRVLLHDGVSPLPATVIPVVATGAAGARAAAAFVALSASAASAGSAAGAGGAAVAGFAAGAESTPGALDTTDWARILFTSGTTGRPKGVVHTHAGRWLAAQLLRQGLAARMASGSTLLLTPFSHGSSLLAWALLPGGMPVHLLHGFDPERVGALVRSGEVEHVFAPPAVLVRLVELFRGERIRPVRTLLTGTAPLPGRLYAEARAIFGPTIRITYGMTEIFNPITVLEPDETEQRYASLGEAAVGHVGWPAPGVEVSIRDEAGNALPDGETGEIFLHAKHMYAGYLRARGQFEPAAPFHATGDLGAFDPALGLRVQGRLHDVVKTGGYKVNPLEVEAALRERGAGGDFVVLGLPSERWGEVVALARAQSPAAPFDDVRGAAAALTPYKRPRLLVPIDAVPRNSIGKVDRAAIRRDIEARYELVDGARPALRPRGD